MSNWQPLFLSSHVDTTLCVFCDFNIDRIIFCMKVNITVSYRNIERKIWHSLRNNSWRTPVFFSTSSNYILCSVRFMPTKILMYLNFSCKNKPILRYLYLKARSTVSFFDTFSWFLSPWRLYSVVQLTDQPANPRY